MTLFLLFAIVFGLSVAVGFRGNRVVASVVLQPLPAFCGFGFLASFEPGVQVFWKIGYAISGLACFVGGVYRWLTGCGPMTARAKKFSCSMSVLLTDSGWQQMVAPESKRWGANNCKNREATSMTQHEDRFRKAWQIIKGAK